MNLSLAEFDEVDVVVGLSFPDVERELVLLVQKPEEVEISLLYFQIQDELEVFHRNQQ